MGSDDETARPDEVDRIESKRRRVLGNYEILGSLGAGATSHVHRARDVTTGEVVALKLLSRTFTPESGPRTRFQRESEVLAELRHPHIVRLLGNGIDDEGHPYLALELVEGPSLRQRLRDDASEVEGSAEVAVNEAVAISLQVLSALHVAHERGIIHRDIKPENVLFDEAGSARVIDLGLSYLMDGSRITKRGDVLGSPGYISPEQIQGAEVDARADLYSVGCLLYEMLTGRPPFELVDERDPASFFRQVLEHDPTDVRTLRPAITPALAAVVHRAIDRDAEARYESAATFAEALAKLPIEPADPSLIASRMAAAKRRATSGTTTMIDDPKSNS